MAPALSLTPLPHSVLDWSSPMPVPRYPSKVPPLVVAALGYTGEQRFIAVYQSPLGLVIEDGRKRKVEPANRKGDTALTRFNLMRESYPFAEGFRGHNLGDGEVDVPDLTVMLIDRHNGDLYVMDYDRAKDALNDHIGDRVPAEVSTDVAAMLFYEWLQGQRELFPPLYKEP